MSSSDRRRRSAYAAALQKTNEEALAYQIRFFKLPTPQREFSFHPTRRWRFDFAFVEFKLAVELEGLTRSGIGRHQRIAGFEADAEKYLAAAELGWEVLRVTGRMVKNWSAVRTIEMALTRKTGVRA